MNRATCASESFPNCFKELLVNEIENFEICGGRFKTIDKLPQVILVHFDFLEVPSTCSVSNHYVLGALVYLCAEYKHKNRIYCISQSDARDFCSFKHDNCNKTKIKLSCTCVWTLNDTLIWLAADPLRRSMKQSMWKCLRRNYTLHKYLLLSTLFLFLFDLIWNGFLHTFSRSLSFSYFFSLLLCRSFQSFNLTSSLISA